MKLDDRFWHFLTALFDNLISLLMKNQQTFCQKISSLHSDFCCAAHHERWRGHRMKLDDRVDLTFFSHVNLEQAKMDNKSKAIFPCVFFRFQAVSHCSDFHIKTQKIIHIHKKQNKIVNLETTNQASHWKLGQ